MFAEKIQGRGKAWVRAVCLGNSMEPDSYPWALYQLRTPSMLARPGLSCCSNTQTPAYESYPHRTYIPGLCLVS